jgi:hypothetical protein
MGRRQTADPVTSLMIRISSSSSSRGNLYLVAFLGAVEHVQGILALLHFHGRQVIP